MSRGPHDFVDPMKQLDAYLDNQLAADDRARFEMLLEHDPVLRSHIARQRQIDRSLQRMFIPAAINVAALLERALPRSTAHETPHVEHKPAQTKAPAHQNGSIKLASKNGFEHRASTRRSFEVRRPLAMAAVLFFLLLGPVAGYQTWQAYDYGRQRSSVVHVTPLEVAFENEVAAGFEAAPAAGCEPEKADPLPPKQAFLTVIKDRFNEKLVMTDPPADVQLLGITYPSAISPYTVALLAKSGSTQIEVFADSDSASAAQSAAAQVDVHVYRRQVGSIMLYEVSKLDHPVLLDLVSKK